MKEYLKKHYLLVIGIVLYFIVYVISANYDPWFGDIRPGMIENAGEVIDLYRSDALPDNTIMKLIPLDILCYGISDVAVLMHNGVMALFALIAVASYLLDYVLEKLFKKTKVSKPEQILTEYFYANILFYILSVIIAYIQKNSEFDPSMIFEWLTPPQGAWKIVALLCLIVGIIILVLALLWIFLPMIPCIAYFFVYFEIFDAVCRLIYFLDQSVFGKFFGEGIFPKEVLSFCTAFILIAVFNIVLEKLYTMLQRLSLRPAFWVLKLFKKKRNNSNNSGGNSNNNGSTSTP
jgi:hypothetical protein